MGLFIHFDICVLVRKYIHGKAIFSLMHDLVESIHMRLKDCEMRRFLITLLEMRCRTTRRVTLVTTLQSFCWYSPDHGFHNANNDCR